MLNKIICIGMLYCIAFSVNAQSVNETDNIEKKPWFKKENMFVGGNIDIGFTSISTTLGISPYVGYSLNKYLDVAVSSNFLYQSQRDYVAYGDKLRQTIYGPGAFIRAYPLKFLFAQAQYEFNFIQYKYIPVANSGQPTYKEKIDAHSLLLGGGWANGRQGIGSNYYYLSVLWDVAGNKNSPYVDGLGRSVPIFKIGYNIAINQGKRK